MINFESPLSIQLRKEMVRGIRDFDMISDGDKIMVCVSGGKDSSVLLALLKEAQKKAPFHFTIEAVMLDQKQPGFSAQTFIHWVKEELNIPFHLIEKDTYSIVKEKTPEGKTYCTLCSKFRRAILYDFAFSHGFTKMALGHHREDINTTALLNMFYVGTMATMPPKLKSDDGRNIIIRPLVYLAEEDILNLSIEWNIPTLPCNLCSSQENLKRNQMKLLLKDLEKKIPNVSSSLLTSLSQVHPRHLLDKNLWNFDHLKRNE
ncbi:MAG TPA: tRNA 2-thiocytidine(32) synthetase TtcA [Pseudobdellovibrionaceae bacterium]|nr:tRNA 2-thiocytidine(32) synthetase TtcA [Pseudobdellovibrionaceae bacterium]